MNEFLEIMKDPESVPHIITVYIVCTALVIAGIIFIDAIWQAYKTKKRIEKLIWLTRGEYNEKYKNALEGGLSEKKSDDTDRLGASHCPTGAQQPEARDKQ